MERTTHTSTRTTPSFKTYNQPVYRDHPANAVGVTGHFVLTSDEALYILDTAANARRLHFDAVKLLDRRVFWIRHTPSPAGGFSERRTRTVDGALMVSGFTFLFLGREENGGELLHTMSVSLDDLVRDFALVKRPDEARKAA